MSSYRHDVFVSYRRTELIRAWLGEFLHLFRFWLGEELGAMPSIFVDEISIEAGRRWPAEVRDALLRSRCLVPIWSPTYFTSTWCLSEWRTFEAKGPNLVVPIRFHDRDAFPAEARDIQMADFAEYTFVGPGFKSTEAYVAFQRETKRFAASVGSAVRQAPPFDAGWKVVEIEPVDPDPPIRVAKLA